MPAFWQISQGGNFCLLIGLKNTNLVEDVEILLPVKFRWIPFSGFREEVENVPANQRPGRPSCFSIGPKNTNLVEDVEILLPVKFRWIPFSGFIGEVENVSANQRPGRLSCFSDRPEKNTNLVDDVEILLLIKFRWIPFSGSWEEVENVSANQRPERPSWFSDRPEKHKLGRGRWDLASCQVSLNSVERFQRRSRKCLSQSEARAAILFFWSARKNTHLVEDVEILLLIKFRWIPLSGSREEVENVSANQRPGRPSWFSDRPEKHKLGRGRWDLAPCQVSLNSVQRFHRRSRKCLSQSEARAAILFFWSARKNTHLVEDVEILLLIKFRWIPLSGSREEVENVSANQRPGRPSWFSDRPEKHKLGRGRWDLASCQVSLNSVERCQRRSRKCEKLTTDGQTDRQTDGRTTDDGQRVITIVYLSLRLRCTKNQGVFVKHSGMPPAATK